MTPLESRLNSLERVITNTKPALAAQAVSLLLAFPDEEKKIEALLRLMGTVPLETKNLISSYLEDYALFIDESEKNYPEIHAAISPEILFRIQYFYAQQSQNSTKVLELLDRLPECKAPEYAEALVACGLETNRPEQVKKGLNRIKPEEAIALAEKLQNCPHRGYLLQYTLTSLLLHSATETGTTVGIIYLEELLTQNTKKIAEIFEIVEKHPHSLYNDPKGQELMELAIEKTYDCSQDKEDIVQRVLGIQKKKGLELAGKLAQTKSTFPEIYRLGEMALGAKVSAQLVEPLFNQALEKENSYANRAKIATLLAEKGAEREAQEHFAAALKLPSSNSEMEQTADLLLNKNFPELAERFYLKAFNQSTDAEKLGAVGVKLLEAKRKNSAADWLDRSFQHDATYARAIKIARAFLFHKHQDGLEKYFYLALKQDAASQELLITGEELAKNRQFTLAEKFYDHYLQRTAEKTGSIAENLEIANQCLAANHRNLAIKYLRGAAEKAESLEQYLKIYAPVLKEFGQDLPILMQGLNQFGDKRSYQLMLSVVEKHYSLTAAVRLVEAIETNCLLERQMISPGAREALDEYKIAYVARLDENDPAQILRKLQEKKEPEKKEEKNLPVRREPDQEEEKKLAQEGQMVDSLLEQFNRK